MNPTYTVEELANAINNWCDQHGVVPANGQAGERMTGRNVRYYRTLGIVDAPAGGGGPAYGDKHRLQLIATRLLQSQGLPLHRIRDLLVGRTLEDLREIEKRGLAELRVATRNVFRPSGSESWTVTPLDDEFLLISRHGRGLSAAVHARLLSVLNPRRRSAPPNRVAANQN